MATIVTHSSAGVYTSEKDNSQGIVQTAQVSIGAIVFFSEIGPVDQIIEITGGQAEFLSKFGSPKYEVSLGHYAALQALTKMPKLLCTRVHNRAKFGGLVVTLDNSGLVSMRQFTTAKDVHPEDPNMFFMELGDADYNDVNDLFYIYGADPNKYNGDYRIVITDVRDEDDKSLPNTFKIQVFVKGSNSVIPVESFVVSRSHQTDGYGRQQFLSDVINGRSRFIRVYNNDLNTTKISTSIMPTMTLNYLGTTPSAVPNAYLSNGDSGLDNIPLNGLSAIIMGRDALPSNMSNPYTPYKNSGWQLYYEREEVKFQLLINGGYTNPQIQLKMLDLCETRGDCMAILDIPFDKQGSKYDRTTDPVDYRNNPYGGLDADSSYGALYSPWYYVNDEFSGKQIWLPPSGFIAAIYAETDINYATWFSPAGLNRGMLHNVIDVGAKYKQEDRDLLVTNQICPTRVFKDIGIAVWGDVTLQKKDSATSNINVRRLLNLIKLDVEFNLQYSVFDPNDEILRSEIRQRVNNILEPIRLGRGLYTYSVVCDGTNNSVDDLANGILNVDVYLEPVIPAKRIMVQLIINRTSVKIEVQS
jgi:hypothetical protein